MTAAMTVTAFAAAVPSGRNLPEFRYTNDAPYMNTILDYVKKTDGQYYDAGDVMIPNYIVLKADESDPQDVKVWGNFWTMNYDLQGDNLFTKNGGEVSGLIHLRKTPAGYEVTGFDKVGDGSSYTPDMNRIFGVDQALMNAFRNLDAVKEQNRADTIRKYVMQNGLNIRTYQDYGWDKVPLF